MNDAQRARSYSWTTAHLGPPMHFALVPADQYLRRTKQPPFQRYVAEQVRWLSATHDKRGQSTLASQEISGKLPGRGHSKHSSQRLQLRWQ